jgi:hypothetical protein
MAGDFYLRNIRIIAMLVCFFVLAHNAAFAYSAVQPSTQNGAAGSAGNRLVALNAPTATLTAIAIKETLAYSAQAVQLTIEGTYSDHTTAAINDSTVTWASSDSNVATVDGTGKTAFTGRNGDVTITAAYQGKTNSVSTTVANQLSLSSIKITATPFGYSDSPFHLTATGTYSDNPPTAVSLSNVKWTSSDTNIATVDAS